MRSVMMGLFAAVAVSAQSPCPGDQYHSSNSNKCEPKPKDGDYCNTVKKCMSPFKCVDSRCENTDYRWEPPIAGIMGGKSRPKLVLGVDIDYPPYATLISPPEGEYRVGGFGADFAKGMMSVCDIDVVVTEVKWADCWGNGVIGTGLKAGELHACMTYSHTQGVRNRFLDFSHGILDLNKPAGLLVRLDGDGNPLVDPKSNLDGLTVVDVVGWAPTDDTLALVKNSCTGESFTGFKMTKPTNDLAANDAALKTLLDGEADAVWIYADQADNYVKGCKNEDFGTEGWDCDLWEQFGTSFAYVHTGMMGYAVNGTTLTISKKGSGISEIVNPCIDAFIQTESYWNICQKYDSLTSSCYQNAFTSADAVTPDQAYHYPTSEQKGLCSTGYCSC